MYAFFVNIELISKHQSGFRPGDSTVNQLLAITDEIFKSFENHAEPRAAFLDISKALTRFGARGSCLSSSAVVSVAGFYSTNASTYVYTFRKNQEG